ncbi:MAG: alpha/beta hydrolase, partial [Lachnospiraceae bacterium]|nr:alpha/beta hydrolase [Lachnospiraceae bacterium]
MRGRNAMNEKQNKRLMHLVKRAHGLLENNDIQKQRTVQNQLGNILGNNKNYTFTPQTFYNLYAEWTDYIPNELATDHNDAVIFYCHGGGYMTGSCVYARELTTKLARHTGARIFCFDYRLAPEFPYPAAVEDAMSAWNAFLYCGYHAENVIIAGDSAGGNLALVLTLILREKNMTLPKSLILFSPWTDMTSSGKSYHSKELIDPVLSNEYIAKAISSYLGSASALSPYVSPLFADFKNFPPVYIQVGSNEILLDDSRQLYKQLLKHNVYAKLDIFEGMWHVFQMSPLKTAYDAMEKNAEF